MTGPSERLYALLPAVYRVRDAELGSPLRALLGVMEDELRAIEGDIEDLYESWFVETAPDWVIPYIGALVGNRPIASVAHTRRADVAKTIYYRRRKGTLPMLEELARDVTGWGAHAVEFMERLAWTQNVNHLRHTASPNPGLVHPHASDRVGTLNVRNRDALDRLAGPWDESAHTIDVRRAPPGVYIAGVKPAARAEEGWYGTRKLGFFLWRIRDYPLRDVSARQAAVPNAHGWHFSPLGAPVPLFTNTNVDRDPARLASEIQVPGPIRPIAFRTDLDTYRDTYLALPPDQRPPNAEWYGADRSISVTADDRLVLPEEILCKDLEAWDRPPAGRIAVDVRRGRIAFAAGEEPEDVHVRFAYGGCADIGGGPYDRRASTEATVAALTALRPGQALYRIAVARNTAVATLQAAVTQWESDGKPPALLEIQDSEAYDDSVAITLPAGGWLAVHARNEQVPSLRLAGDLTIVAPAEGARLTIDGLLIAASVSLAGPVTLDLTHSTIVPGRTLTEDGDPAFLDRDSIVTVDATDEPTVTLTSSITGPIRLPSTARSLTIRDSIVQAFFAGGVARPAIAAPDVVDAPGPATTIERATILGPVFVRELTLASNVIFAAPVIAERKQAGCVRHSLVPAGSDTPRRFRCQPDLALAGVTDPVEEARIRARLSPRFTSTRYCDPAFAQLRGDTTLEIQTGADNGAEMGVFSSLMQPQREANLRTRLDEYMPFGLEAALIYVT